MRLRVKTNQVRPQQSVNQLTLPGTNSEHFRIRPRNMPENCYARIRTGFLHHSRQEREVIILRQQDGRFRAFHFIEHRIGKVPVGLLVTQPVVGTKNGACMRDMAKGPQSFVGETLVIAFLFFCCQPHAPQVVAGPVRRDAQAIVRIHGLAVCATCAVRDPCSVAGQQHRFQGGNQSTGRNDYAHGSILVQYMHVRFAIGNHEKWLALQFISQAYAQALRSPLRSIGVAQTRLFFSGSTRRV